MNVNVDSPIKKERARLKIRRGGRDSPIRYDEFDVEFEEGESVLDGLVRLRQGAAPDLAFQFSCFNANVCKECVMMIDSAIEYACIAKLKPGLTILEPVPYLHVLRDLLVDSRDREEKGAELRHQMIALKRSR